MTTDNPRTPPTCAEELEELRLMLQVCEQRRDDLHAEVGKWKKAAIAADSRRYDLPEAQPDLGEDGTTRPDAAAANITDLLDAGESVTQILARTGYASLQSARTVLLRGGHRDVWERLAGAQVAKGLDAA